MREEQYRGKKKKKRGIEGIEEGGVQKKEGESIERVEGWNVVFWNQLIS